MLLEECGVDNFECEVVLQVLTLSGVAWYKKQFYLFIVRSLNSSS